MIGVSEEAGRRELRQRESGGDADIGKWYEAAVERMATAAFATIETAFGLADARGLALWMVATQPGVQPFEVGSMWTEAFTLIAQYRPSVAYVEQHVPDVVLPAIRAAFGERSGQALDEVVRMVESEAMSDEDRVILAWDPSTVDPGWPPLRDAVGEFGLYARHFRARALVKVISRLLDEEQWEDLERRAQDWPG
jgi:hypothetical protein